MQISHFLVKADNAADYIPLVSTAANLTDIFQKYVVLPLLSPTQNETIANSYYYVHLKYKSIFRCVILLIPILGNIVIAFCDVCNKESNKEKSKELFKQAQKKQHTFGPMISEEKKKNLKQNFSLKQKPEPLKQLFYKMMENYQQAALLGNSDAMYWLGKFYDKDSGIFQSKGIHFSGYEEDKPLAVAFYKQAAAKGHPDAMQRLGDLPQSPKKTEF